MYMCMWGCLDKYIRVATWPPQTKIPGSAPGQLTTLEGFKLFHFFWEPKFVPPT